MDSPGSLASITAIPYGCAVIAMLAIAKNADRTRERRWHLASASALGGLYLMLATICGDNVVLVMAALSLGTAGLLATMPMF